MPDLATAIALIDLGTAPDSDWALCALILAAALPFQPWLPLRHGPLIHPWLGAMVLLPLLWSTEHLLPNGMTMHVSSACLMTLMFGWPLAMWSLVPVAFGWLPADPKAYPMFFRAAGRASSRMAAGMDWKRKPPSTHHQTRRTGVESAVGTAQFPSPIRLRP